MFVCPGRCIPSCTWAGVCGWGVTGGIDKGCGRDWCVDKGCGQRDVYHHRATEVGATHPTGINSCCVIILHF